MEEQLAVTVNKTVVFYSPLEKEDVTVRTGTIDNISFIHSVLHAYSREYSHLEEVERQNLVDKVYGELLTIYTQELLTQSKPQIHELILSFITNFLAENNTDVYEILAEVIPVPEISRIFADHENPDAQVLTVLQTNLTAFQLEEERIQYCLSKMTNLLAEAHEHAEKKIRPESLPLNRHVINIFGNYINRDIFCLNFHTRMPIHERSSDYKKRKSIVLLQLEYKKKLYKYEVIGKLLPGNRVQREFDYKDPFVKSIRIFLYEPDRFAEDYPDLVEYLPSYSKSPSHDKSPVHSPYRN